MPRLIAPPDRPSRWKLLLRRQRRRARGLLLSGCAVLVLLGLGLGLWRIADGHALSLRGRFGALAALGGLRVQRVVVQGRLNTPQAQLDRAIGAPPGTPLLAVSIAEARARLESIAWVQSATVERRLPDTILVSLVERRPFAVWQNQGRFSLIDREGQTVPDQDIAAFGQLPLVVGAGAPAAAAALLDALAAYPPLLTHVVAAVRVGGRRWNLHLTSGGDVLLPEGQEAAALKRLAELQQAHALLDRPLQVVDMRLPDRLVLRPQPGEPKGAGG